MNLHKIEIETDCQHGEQQKDYSIDLNAENIQVYFKNLERHLIKRINAADIVIGCVAWLTSKPILKALSNKKAVAIVVQKEDFLRPDINQKGRWLEDLRVLYNNLPSGLSRYDDILSDSGLDTVLYFMSCCGTPDIEAIRCVGNHNSEKIAAFPRSHHKFLLFCKGAKVPEHWQYKWEPYQVWTGSYNLTKNAGMSFENAVVLNHKKIVKAYFQEWAQIEALSEPLNWDSKWCEPEWRIGS